MVFLARIRELGSLFLGFRVVDDGLRPRSMGFFSFDGGSLVAGLRLALSPR